ncbi:NADH-quinone oxidoreductase subunit NuoF, partial [bacterium]|nr:NADH-quinone oxidoreductase subunit NuoF [bacterium]
MANETRVLLEHLGTPDLLTVNGYRGTGGYKALEKALKEMSPEQVTEEVKTSGLQGRGGAAFPTGMKWSFIPKNSAKPVYLACNADESEPGTCKDRVIIDENPHQLIEGMLITCYAIGSHTGYIYIRGEFHRGAQILSMAIEEARREGLIGKDIFGSGFDCEIEVYRGAGAYICGEETGLLTSLEGQKGYPRNKPPFPAISGLYDSPTIINNVETLAVVPSIVEKGGEWYKAMGTEKSTGTKLLCLSGHVNKPGVYEVALGEQTLREFIMDFGGGIPGGKKIKGVIPGGSSMPVMRDEELDVKLTFEDIREAGSSRGSGAIIVMDET